MADIIGIITSAFQAIPAHRWKGNSQSGKKIEITAHAVGIDQRGPWAKFHFTEGEGADAQEKEIQGYPLYRGGARVRMGNGKEFDEDKMGVQVKVEDFKVHTIVSFSGKMNGEELHYEFDGQNN